MYRFYRKSCATMLRNLLFGLLAAAGVVAQYSYESCPDTSVIKGTPFPKLIDVTLEELETGLESGLFSSVDLVTVCRCQHTLCTSSADKIGVHSTYQRNEQYPPHGHRAQPRCPEYRRRT